MAFYNAVIVSPFDKKKILGRTLLTNYDVLPSESKVIHHSGRRIYRNDFKKTLADPIKPMIITRWLQKPARSGIDTFRIFVETEAGTTIKLDVNHFQTLKDVKEMIADIEGISIYEQILKFGGRFLRGYHVKLADHNIQTNDVLHVRAEQYGGGYAPLSLSVHDLEGQCVTGVGREGKPEDAWKAFSQGLNIIGRCGDSSCNSTKRRQDVAKIRCGYSTVSLRPHTDIPCPACDGGGFKPSNFLLSGAKADFRFRKTGEHEVKSVIVESGKFPEYKMFAESEEKVDYELIEISAVPLDGSLCYCGVCSKVIEGGEKNLKMACGHMFHQNCHEPGKDCEVCQAQFILDDDFENFLAGILK